MGIPIEAEITIRSGCFKKFIYFQKNIVNDIKKCFKLTNILKY